MKGVLRYGFNSDGGKERPLTRPLASRSVATRFERVCGGSPRAPEPRTVRGGIAQARLAHPPSSRGLKAAPSPRAAGVCANPAGFAVAHVTKARVARHENLPVSRREHEKACAILLEQAGQKQGALSGAKSAKKFDAKSAKGVDAKNAKILEAKNFVSAETWVGSRRRRDCKVEAVSHRFKAEDDLLASAGSSTPPCLSGRVESCNRERMSVRERGEAFSCNRPTGVKAFVSRSAFVTGMRGEPERLAPRHCRRAKPQGFGCGGKDATSVGWNARRRADPVRGSGVWGQCPHQKRTTSFVEAVRRRFHSEYLLAAAKRADALAGAL